VFKIAVVVCLPAVAIFLAFGADASEGQLAESPLYAFQRTSLCDEGFSASAGLTTPIVAAPQIPTLSFKCVKNVIKIIKKLLPRPKPSLPKPPKPLPHPSRNGLISCGDIYCISLRDPGHCISIASPPPAGCGGSSVEWPF